MLMAAGDFYDCTHCHRRVALFSRSKRETMLIPPDGEKSRDMWCLDCKIVVKIIGDNLKICNRCSGRYLSVNNSLPCGCCPEGRLIHEDGNYVSF